MPQGALTVHHDGTLTVAQHLAKDTAALEAALSGFADLVCPTADPRVYRLTAASIWRARRAGLVLEEMLQTLETSSPMELPPTVRADITRWSHQIDRLTLEAAHGCLLLRSTHPLVLTAVQRHRTLGAFITRHRDPVTVELRLDAYPALVHTFDACGHPVLDRVPRCHGTSEAKASGSLGTSREQVSANFLTLRHDREASSRGVKTKLLRSTGIKFLIRCHSASGRSVGYGLAVIPPVSRTGATSGRLSNSL